MIKQRIARCTGFLLIRNIEVKRCNCNTLKEVQEMKRRESESESFSSKGDANIIRLPKGPSPCSTCTNISRPTPVILQHSPHRISRQRFAVHVMKPRRIKSLCAQSHRFFIASRPQRNAQTWGTPQSPSPLANPLRNRPDAHGPMPSPSLLPNCAAHLTATCTQVLDRPFIPFSYILPACK